MLLMQTVLFRGISRNSVTSLFNLLLYLTATGNPGSALCVAYFGVEIFDSFQRETVTEIPKFSVSVYIIFF